MVFGVLLGLLLLGIVAKNRRDMRYLKLYGIDISATVVSRMGTAALWQYGVEYWLEGEMHPQNNILSKVKLDVGDQLDCIYNPRKKQVFPVHSFKDQKIGQLVFGGTGLLCIGISFFAMIGVYATVPLGLFCSYMLAKRYSDGTRDERLEATFVRAYWSHRHDQMNDKVKSVPMRVYSYELDGVEKTWKHAGFSKSKTITLLHNRVTKEVTSLRTLRLYLFVAAFAFALTAFAGYMILTGQITI